MVFDLYLNDLRNLLVKSSLTEQRSFLKSLVEKKEQSQRWTGNEMQAIIATVYLEK